MISQVYCDKDNLNVSVIEKYWVCWQETTTL